MIRVVSPPVDVTPLAIAAAVAIHTGHMGPVLRHSSATAAGAPSSVEFRWLPSGPAESWTPPE
jgi:hypothetical protein